MRNIIPFLIILMLLSSCSRRLLPIESVRDSIVERKVIEKVRDTAVIFYPDSSLIEALLECDSLRRVQIKQITTLASGKNLLPPTISIKDNIISARAHTDYRVLYFQLKDRYEHLLVKKQETIIRVKEVNVLTWYQKTLIYLGKLSVIILIIFIIRKIK